LTKGEFLAKWTTTYQAIAGTALAQGINVNTSSIFTSEPNFAIGVTNLWNEYRCEAINLKVTFTFNVAQAGLYIPSIYLAQFRGDTAPAQTLAGLTALPWVRVMQPNRSVIIKWSRPKDDPEAAQFRQTNAALPILGGIVGYMGASPPISTVVYAVISVKAKLALRGRKI
jgi:hypothetical protein